MRKKATKDMLGDSFRELVRQKPVNKITIADITENCGLTQPTFYNHFHDKYDLMAWLYISDSQRIMKQIGQGGYQWKNTLLDGLVYFAEHKSELMNAFTHTSGREAFLGNMMRINTDLLCTEVRKKLMTENIPDDILLMIKIYCYGTVSYVCEWIADNMPVAPENVADAMERSLPDPLKPCLYPP